MKNVLLAKVLLLALALAFSLAQEDAGGADGSDEPAGTATQGALRTASYGLFPLGAGGVSGHLNVSERLEGGTRLVVTLVGIEQGDRYLPVLFGGDCGPDGERVRALPPVGSMENDPFVSIFEADLSFDELSAGDYFMYVYPGDTEEGDPVTCGEVGEGANREGE